MSPGSENPSTAKRRGRSRSPSALLKSSKKSIKGILGKKPKGGTGTTGSKRNLTVPNAEETPASVADDDIDEASKISSVKEDDDDDDEDFDDEVTTYSVRVDNSAASPAKQLTPVLVEEEATPAVVEKTPTKEETTVKPQDTKYSVAKEPVKEAVTKRAAPKVESAPEKKKVKSAPATPPKSPGGNRRQSTFDCEVPLQVVLLLMDALSRRFELIQLAFDAENASVKDVIGQVSISATEEALRAQIYTDVCLADGTIMKNDAQLKDYYERIEDQNNILLAIPSGMKPEDCTKLAVPILNDPKVKAMLSGIETPNKAAKSASKKKLTEASTKSAPPTAAAARSKPESDEEPSSSGSASVKLLLVFMTILAPIVAFVHGHITTPLSPGDVLPAGHWRSSCGLLALIPKEYSECNNSVLELTSDGLLTFTDDEQTVLWSMEGVCVTDSECVATVGQDGKIKIGDTDGKIMEGGKGIVAPWPFTTEPGNKKGKRKKQKKNRKGKK